LRTVTCIPRFEVCGLCLQPRVLGGARRKVADEERGPRRGRAPPPRLRCHGAATYLKSHSDRRIGARASQVAPYL